MNIRWGIAAAALAFTVAVSASAQGSTAVGSVCKDGTNDATIGRGACSRHGGVDKAATKAQKVADKAAKTTKKASRTARSTAVSTATVTCKDGSTSHAKRGACAHHGGVTSVAGKTADSAMTATAPPSPPARARMSTTSTSKVGNGSSDNTDPAGAIAQCKDGTYSHAKHRTGTCGHHGGVGKWM